MHAQKKFGDLRKLTHVHIVVDKFKNVIYVYTYII